MNFLRLLLVCSYRLTIAWVLMATNPASGQDAAWWIANVGWDGVSHWSEYLSYVPKTMGPNALPVPPANQARIPEGISAEVMGWARQGRGDLTLNPEIRIAYPFGQFAALAVRHVPVEWYQASHEVKTLRKVFYEGYDKQTSAGDFYVDGLFQLLSQARHGCDVQLRAGIKTASGTARDAARHTDTPGYYFDVGLAKTKDLPNGNMTGFLSLGFLVYQTGKPNVPQNDALQYGVGAIWESKNWRYETELAGYQGYFNAGGDKPVVFRAAAWRRMGAFSPGLRFENGLQDYPFVSLSASCLWRLPQRIP